MAAVRSAPLKIGDMSPFSRFQRTRGDLRLWGRSKGLPPL